MFFLPFFILFDVKVLHIAKEKQLTRCVILYVNLYLATNELFVWIVFFVDIKLHIFSFFQIKERRLNWIYRSELRGHVPSPYQQCLYITLTIYQVEFNYKYNHLPDCILFNTLNLDNFNFKFFLLYTLFNCFAGVDSENVIFWVSHYLSVLHYILSLQLQNHNRTK